MGMDVSGKNPACKAGVYFRSSVWSWHPLWDYCRAVAPHVITERTHKACHCNDGRGLDEPGAAALAEILRAEIASGRTSRYEQEHRERLAALPDEPCDVCGGVGRRRKPPEVGPGALPCNGCTSTGKRRPFATHYPFRAEHVAEFAEFLAVCGGFEVW